VAHHLNPFRQCHPPVTQSPEKGKANKAVIELMAKSLGLRKSQIELLSGETSHQKRFLIHGIKSGELAQSIAKVTFD
jgi:hypothetical protein